MAPETTRPEKVTAPFTAEQVTVLNQYQHSGFFHPFTCGRCRDTLGCEKDERLLVATLAGWVCPTCDNTQDWCHAFMADPDAPWMQVGYDALAPWR